MQNTLIQQKDLKKRLDSMKVSNAKQLIARVKDSVMSQGCFSWNCGTKYHGHGNSLSK